MLGEASGPDDPAAARLGPVQGEKVKKL